MQRCFVIQPFDGDRFDRRFDDVFVPAIRAADLEPYRVDRDRKVSQLIEAIEKEIAASAICLADITLDNPNVWYELGLRDSLGRRELTIGLNRYSARRRLVGSTTDSGFRFMRRAAVSPTVLFHGLRLSIKKRICRPFAPPANRYSEDEQPDCEKKTWGGDRGRGKRPGRWSHTSLETWCALLLN